MCICIMRLYTYHVCMYNIIIPPPVYNNYNILYRYNITITYIEFLFSFQIIILLWPGHIRIIIIICRRSIFIYYIYRVMFISAYNTIRGVMVSRYHRKTKLKRPRRPENIARRQNNIIRIITHI